jgi:hypothetical protein
LFDAHRDDPEFGSRFLTDEARAAGQPMVERTAWKICSGMGWCNTFSRSRRRSAVEDEGSAPGRPGIGMASNPTRRSAPALALVATSGFWRELCDGHRTMSRWPAV